LIHEATSGQKILRFFEPMNRPVWPGSQGNPDQQNVLEKSAAFQLPPSAGIRVVPGGTKARFAARLFDSADEVVYGSLAEGGAQTVLALTASGRGLARLNAFRIEAGCRIVI
jgi:hypothetical protein